MVHQIGYLFTFFLSFFIKMCIICTMLVFTLTYMRYFTFLNKIHCQILKQNFFALLIYNNIKSTTSKYLLYTILTPEKKYMQEEKNSYKDRMDKKNKMGKGQKIYRTKNYYFCFFKNNSYLRSKWALSNMVHKSLIDHIQVVFFFQQLLMEI